MENLCSEDQVKAGLDFICRKYSNKTWPLLDDSSNKRTINVQFLKENEEDDIDFEKEIVIDVVNNNIQLLIDNRIKFLSQEEVNNNVRSDIRISFSKNSPNYSEIGTNSLNVTGRTMNLASLNSEDIITSRNIIIEQIMKALGYEICAMIKYNLDLGRTYCETYNLFKESILNTVSSKKSISINDIEWLENTYNKKVDVGNNDCVDSVYLEQHNSHCNDKRNKFWTFKNPAFKIISIQFLENYNNQSLIFDTQDYETKKNTVIDIVNNDLQPHVGVKFEVLKPKKLQNYIRENIKPDIRITFISDNFNFSYTGTDSITSLDERSMNLVDLDRRTILQQFITALGFESCNIINYYLDSGFTICNTMKELDSNSILSTKIGSDKLSENDIKMLQSVYPLEEGTKKGVVKGEVKSSNKNSILKNPAFLGFLVLAICVLVIIFIIKLREYMKKKI